MAEPTRGFIEVHDPAGAKTQYPLQGGRVIFGRTDEANIRLDSGAVSRQHADVSCDPFGRWWVRDLKSRNGTLVNGQPIVEHLIQPGDTIQIDEFLITVQLTDAVPERPRTKVYTSVTMTDQRSGSIQRLDDLQSPQVAAKHLKALATFSSKLMQTESDDERLKMLCQLMISKDFHGTSALAMRLADGKPETDPPEMLCEPVSARNWRSGETPYVSKSVLRAMRESKAPILASNIGSGVGVVEMSLAGDVAQISTVACPFHISPTSIDILYVSLPAEYGTGEWLHLAALAAEFHQQAQANWTARRQAQSQALVEQELDQARNIQMRLVPHKLEVPGLDIDLNFEPCKWVGGDYIDVLPTSDGRAFVIVADVCGKGLQAALITATLHSMLHTNAHAGTVLSDLIGRLNQYLCATLPEESFVTAIGMVVDLKTGDFECINAGHPPALVVDPAGKVRELQSGENLPLGYMEVEFRGQPGRLEPGHLLALYTDGLTEMSDEHGEMMGSDRLGEMLKTACATGPAGPIAGVRVAFKSQLDTYLGSALPQDDRTFLLLRRPLPA